MKQVTAPTDEFVMERLQRIETITEIDAVSEDHDPNGMLNKQGGYIGCIYFEDSQVDRSQLYIKDGEDNVIDIGTDGGGAIEIFKTGLKSRPADTHQVSAGLFVQLFAQPTRPATLHSEFHKAREYHVVFICWKLS